MIKMTDLEIRNHFLILLDLVENKNGCISYNLREDEVTDSDEELSLYIDAILSRCPIPNPIFIWNYENDEYTSVSPNKFLVAAFKYMTGKMVYKSSIEGMESVPFTELSRQFQRRIYETRVVGYAHICKPEGAVNFINKIYS